MKMIRAIVRPEREKAVVDGLEAAGFTSYTKMEVSGRGRQKGLRVAASVYDELPKIMLMVVVNDDRLERAVSVIEEASRTGSIGDGKIFVTAVENAYTISSGKADL